MSYPRPPCDRTPAELEREFKLAKLERAAREAAALTGAKAAKEARRLLAEEQNPTP